MGRVKEKKKCFQTCAKYTDSDHPAHAQIIIRVFALYSYILRYPMILLADSEGPNHTVRMHRLIWDFAVRICQNTRFRMARPIFQISKRTCDICDQSGLR